MGRKKDHLERIYNEEGSWEKEKIYVWRKENVRREKEGDARKEMLDMEQREGIKGEYVERRKLGERREIWRKVEVREGEGRASGGRKGDGCATREFPY